jgi:large subunit ribosomal protein L19
MIKKELHLIETMAIAESALLRKEKNSGEAVVIPAFKPGDTINIAVRVIEGDKERVQNYQGIVIARRGTGTGATFRVRKISNGVGVERIFPLFSPIIQGITIVSEGSVRRSKLYYLRGMTERQMRTKTRKKIILASSKGSTSKS